MKRTIRDAAVTLAAAAALALLPGCGEEAVRVGTLRGIPATLGPLGYAPTASLSVSAPVDQRPQIEHAGDNIRTNLFFTTIVVTHWERRGNFVTSDEVASPMAVTELHEAMIDALRTANVAKEVVPSGAAEFSLETRIDHLYATHHAVNSGTVMVMEGRRDTHAAVGSRSRQYAAYGNVVLSAKLVDHRSGLPRVIWEEQVVGAGQQPPGRNYKVAAQTALREAVADALATLSVRVGAALDRIQRGPTGPAYTMQGLPPVFLIERVSRYRNFVERVYVDTASGHVLRHEIGPNADPALARPGEWLLSRRSPEGVVLTPEAYESYARALAVRYDLRTVDDLSRYHFFGVRAAQ